MFGYETVQWIFFFYLYSFLGWCWESAFVSVRKKRLVNRGFMRGPFLPLYGSGAIMMLVVSKPFVGNTLLVYFAGCVGATLLELVTGIVMEALFKVRYWDYSNQKFNYKGHICLSSTIAWGFFTIGMTEFLHPPIETWVLSLPLAVLTPVTFVMTVFIVSDFALSFKAALDLRDVLVKMEEAKAEMERLQKRLDVFIAVANDATQTKREEWMEKGNARLDALGERIERGTGRLEDLAEGIGARFDQLREKREALLDQWDEVTELRGRFRQSLENRAYLSHIRRFYNRDQLRNNPTMASRRFAEALEIVKKAAEEYKKEKDIDKKNKEK